MKNHEKQWKTMKTMKNHEKPWKTMKTHEKPWKTMKSLWGRWRFLRRVLVFFEMVDASRIHPGSFISNGGSRAFWKGAKRLGSAERQSSVILGVKEDSGGSWEESWWFLRWWMPQGYIKEATYQFSSFYPAREVLHLLCVILESKRMLQVPEWSLVFDMVDAPSIHQGSYISIFRSLPAWEVLNLLCVSRASAWSLRGRWRFLGGVLMVFDILDVSRMHQGSYISIFKCLPSCKELKSPMCLRSVILESKNTIAVPERNLGGFWHGGCLKDTSRKLHINFQISTFLGSTPSAMCLKSVNIRV